MTRAENRALASLEKAVAHLVDVSERFAEAVASEIRKSGLSPSDVPAPPERDEDHEDAVRQEMRRLATKFHGTQTALRRAAEVSVRSRSIRLDGQRLIPRKKSPKLF